MTTCIKLYTYFRSSAAWRVRIALSLKGLPYEAVPVHLVRNGGEQLTDQYRAINPGALVPSLQDEGAEGATITQSMAIVEYLEETHPAVPLLPSTPLERARVRALAQMIACDIHPLNNLRVLRYLVRTLGVKDEAKTEWYRHWIGEGFAALEAQLTRNPARDSDRNAAPARFCHGSTPTIADCFLVPQVYNAQRFDIDIAAYPNIARINDACAELPAFIAAHPAQQGDSE
ncbi:maleylacetoacetate isomerase [Massilia psychrophila]|jgi:maleylacetoacetate isomerase|nr:maleylacetoacetate isomerase [Massilia psychrophila]